MSVVKPSIRHRYRPHLVSKAQKTHDLDSHYTERKHSPQIVSVSRNTFTMTEDRPYSGRRNKTREKSSEAVRYGPDLELQIHWFRLYRTKGVINFRLQNEVKDTLDVALRSVRRQALNRMKHVTAFMVMFADFMWSRTFHASSLSFAKTRAWKLIGRHPVGANTSRGHLHCQLRSCVEATCIEVRFELSGGARDVQAIDTLHLLYLPFLEEVNGVDEISLSVKPLDDRRGMPLRCRLTAHNLGILGKRVRHVDEVADHLRPTLLHYRVHVLYMFWNEGRAGGGRVRWHHWQATFSTASPIRLYSALEVC